jgi:hypothetical protein
MLRYGRMQLLQTHGSPIVKKHSIPYGTSTRTFQFLTLLSLELERKGLELLMILTGPMI